MPEFFTFFLLTFTALFTYAQDVPSKRIYPQTDFRPPLDLAPSLAGSFGEIRPNHFHSGLDYRTNQREGYPVYAAADGYVSRLRVQIGGGGNIIYLAHPNGYSTVYMHLQKFSPKIQQILRNFQYRQHQFDVDFPLLPIEIQVKKGEVIAWSGNTGGTAGPHLHFEIRDTKTEETLNAQLFGLNIPDNVPPVINGLYAYHLGEMPFSNTTQKQYLQIESSNGNYHINQPFIGIQGNTGFGIMGFDQSVAGGNQKGIYAIELLMDSKPIFSSVFERFNFADTKAVNSHIDYPALISLGRTIQKSFIEPGNPLTIYRENINKGVIDVKDDEVHDMQYRISDIKGNTSILNFKIKKVAQALPDVKPAEGSKLFSYNQDNEFSSEGIKIQIPKGNLYSDINFMYSTSAKPQKGYSPIHHVHTRLIPIHDGYALWIKPDSTLPVNLRDKAIIVDSNRGSAGGSFEDGYIKTNAHYLGNFYVAIDTIAPIIHSINIANGSNMRGSDKIMLKISDNLSGIKNFSATIDGIWELMEYDQKTATLWHTFNKELASGNHVFQLVVTDQKMNSKTYTANFTR